MRINKAVNGFIVIVEGDDYIDNKSYIFREWSELTDWLEDHPVET